MSTLDRCHAAARQHPLLVDKSFANAQSRPAWGESDKSETRRADLRYSNLTGATTDGTDFSFTNFSGVRIGDKVYADPTVCAIRSIGTCRPDTSLSTINWAELTTGSLPEDLNFVTY